MFFFPSNGYDNLPDRIHVEKGSLKFFRLTSLSIAEDDYSPFIDAMQSLVPTIDIYELTIPDFFALVAYARVKLFPSSPITYSHVCRNTVFDTKLGKMNSAELKLSIERGDIDRKEPVNPTRCDFQYKTLIENFENFEVVNLDSDGLDTSKFSVPRVGLLAEYKRLIKDPEYRFLVPAVAWLKDGDTLEEKFAILEAADNTAELVDELSKIAVNYAFGLRSKVTTECPSCGKTSELPIHLDNQSFIRI